MPGSADISEREYNMLMQATNANATALAALVTTLTNLQIQLNREFLTKSEDEIADNERFKDVYAYIDSQKDGLKDQLKILMWSIGIFIVIFSGTLGWLASKVATIPPLH